MAASPSPEVKAILKLTPALTTALSNEPLGVANTLLSKGLISREVYSCKVLMPTYSATEKASIMIDSVRKVVEIAPSKFTEFLDILSEVTSAKEVVESLRSTYQDELTSSIPQRSHQVSIPSNSMSLTTRTASPSSAVNTMSLAPSMTGPSPSQMMQYQARMAASAHHGMGISLSRRRRKRVSHPETFADTTGMQQSQPTPRSMIRVGGQSMLMDHSEMGTIQESILHGSLLADYMEDNTMEMQAHQRSGDIGPSAIHAGRPNIATGMYPHIMPHMTPPHSATSMHSQISTPQGEMIFCIDTHRNANVQTTAIKGIVSYVSGDCDESIQRTGLMS